MSQTTSETDINAWIEHRVAELITNENAHQKLPIHLQDPRFPEAMRSLTGTIEVVGMTLHQKFTKERPDQEFTFAHALKQHTCTIRDYDQIVAAAGGASIEQRLETLESLRMKYLAQQRRFESKYGYIPGDGERGVELQAVDTVLAELNQAVTR